MQKAPVMKSSGLKPFEESKSSDEVVHVFGRNLEDRVNISTDAPSISSSIQITTRIQDEDDIESLRKRKFDAITGEEDEDTVFQGNFKLFVWDLASSNWIEKGRGQLKLNDSIQNDGGVKSRLIMRVNGTLRIILNLSINPLYFRVIATSKTNIRFTDSQNVWAASGNTAQQLRVLLESRLKHSELNESKKQKTSQESDDNAQSDSSPSSTCPRSPQKCDDRPAKGADETTEESEPSAGKEPEPISSQPDEDVRNGDHEEKDDESVSSDEEIRGMKRPKITTTFYRNDQDEEENNEHIIDGQNNEVEKESKAHSEVTEETDHAHSAEDVQKPDSPKIDVHDNEKKREEEGDEDDEKEDPEDAQNADDEDSER